MPKSAAAAPVNGLRPWPADKVDRWPLDQIKPYEHNARLHSDEQVAQIAESMKRFGVTTPLLVDEDGVLIFGHGRRRAAELLGYEEMPVSIARGWTEDEKRAYRLADNQIATNSEWDIPVLNAEYGKLTMVQFPTAIIGFSSQQLSRWGLVPQNQATGDPNEIPKVPAKPVVRVGDIWLCGPHRVAVGDSTDPATWKALLGKDRAAMVFTDPPYGVSYAARSGKFEVIEGDDKRRDDLYKMLVQSLREMNRYAASGAAFYIWHASSTREDFAQAMKAVGIIERQYLIWVKPSIVPGHSDYRWQHEPCFYASKTESKPVFYGDRAESTVWQIQLVADNQTAATIGNGVLILDGAGATLFIQSKAPKNKKLRQIRVTKDVPVVLTGIEQQDTTVWEVSRDGGHEHPTQKPVELARRAITNSSRPGEVVIDGFLGSGTTLIGAELSGRRCFGVELDSVYAEVVIRRWEKLTGQLASLAGTDGETLEQAQRRRRARGASNATGDLGIALSRGNARGNGSKRRVRAPVHVGQPAPGGEPAGQPPAVAGDTE